MFIVENHLSWRNFDQWLQFFFCRIVILIEMLRLIIYFSSNEIIWWRRGASTNVI